MGGLLIVHCWAVIFGAMALFHVIPNPLTFVLAVLLIGARQLGLGVLMHDAAHNALFKTRVFNDWVSDVFCAWPILANTCEYRHYHLKHHAFTQQDQDPDTVLSEQFPVSPASFRRKIFRDLTGQTAYRQRLMQLKMGFGSAEDPPKRRLLQAINTLGPYFCVNAALFLVCAALFHWSYYPLFWVLPLMTSYMAVLRLRNIAEHAFVPDKDDPLRNTRTTRVNLLERVFIAPYWVNYHIEHHLLMYVPCYRLPAIHHHLMGHGFGPKMELVNGFLEIIRSSSSGSDDDPDGKPARTQALVGSLSGGFSKNA
ncbi:MAG: fatty acid desaturase family protein [Parvibaculales bacterium]